MISYTGGLVNTDGRFANSGYSGDGGLIDVQCFPLYSILLALGNPTVDYFALDIEGAELPVLRVWSS